MMSVKNTKTSKHELHRWDVRKPMSGKKKKEKDQSGTQNIFIFDL